LRQGPQQGISVVSRTDRRERLAENFAIFDCALSDAEMRGVPCSGFQERHYRP
jgi:diketogulonate reductase-like aldo/keto reductase